MPRKRGNRFRTHWTADRIITAIQTWNEKWNEPPRRTDWDPTRVEKLAAAAEVKAQVWRQRRHLFVIGDYPSSRTVIQVFGSWNAAVTAAGLTPRLPSQRTKRGVQPSSFLAPLGHAVSDVYEAEREDPEVLRAALLQVARVAQRLARELAVVKD